MVFYIQPKQAGGFREAHGKRGAPLPAQNRPRTVHPGPGFTFPHIGSISRTKTARYTPAFSRGQAADVYAVRFRRYRRRYSRTFRPADRRRRSFSG